MTTIKLVVLMWTVIGPAGQVVHLEEASFNGINRSGDQLKGAMAMCSILKDAMESTPTIKGMGGSAMYSCVVVK